MNKIIKSVFKQFTSYSLVGVFSVGLDMLFYVIFSEIFLISKSNSKIISFVIGSTNSFLGNKLYTFKKRKFNLREPLKFIVLYSISLLANSLTHDYLLEKLNDYLPLIIATIISVIINFNGQRLWVFKKSIN